MLEYVSFGLDDIIWISLPIGNPRPEIAKKAVCAKHAIAVVNRFWAKVNQRFLVIRPFDKKRVDGERPAFVLGMPVAQEMILAKLTTAGVQGNELADTRLLTHAAAAE